MKNFEAGVYVNQESSKSFIPIKINRNWTVEAIEIIDLFISMHVVKEVTKSKK